MTNYAFKELSSGIHVAESVPRHFRSYLDFLRVYDPRKETIKPARRSASKTQLETITEIYPSADETNPIIEIEGRSLDVTDIALLLSTYLKEGCSFTPEYVIKIAEHLLGFQAIKHGDHIIYVIDPALFDRIFERLSRFIVYRENVLAYRIEDLTLTRVARSEQDQVDLGPFKIRLKSFLNRISDLIKNMGHSLTLADIRQVLNQPRVIVNSSKTDSFEDVEKLGPFFDQFVKVKVIPLLQQHATVTASRCDYVYDGLREDVLEEVTSNLNHSKLKPEVPRP